MHCFSLLIPIDNTDNLQSTSYLIAAIENMKSNSNCGNNGSRWKRDFCKPCEEETLAQVYCSCNSSLLINWFVDKIYEQS